MIKQLLKKNKIAQRVKAIKDLFLEKLDALHLKSDQQAGLSSLILEETNKTQHNTNTILDENRKTSRNIDVLLENGAFLLKLGVDMVKGLQRVIEDSQEKQQSIYQAIELIYQDSQEKQQSIYQAIERIYQEFQKIREESQYQKEILDSNKETLERIYTDIHNHKFKVVTDPSYFQSIDIELMTYLYSYLPHQKAIDIGANRGDVSSRLLETGYQVYAFEPFAPVLEKLTARLEKYPNFHVFPWAMGSSNETKNLHIATDQTEDNVYEDETFYSSLTEHSLSEGLVFTDIVPVTVKTLASLHESGEVPTDIGLVKIDTEGFDLEVIKGMGHYRYPVVVAEFWDANFPFGRSGAMNHLPDLVNEMKNRGYGWHIAIYRIWGSHDVSYYCNSSYSLKNSWGNIFFFQDYEIFNQAIKWCSSVMPATYFST